MSLSIEVSLYQECKYCTNGIGYDGVSGKDVRCSYCDGAGKALTDLGKEVQAMILEVAHIREPKP